MIQSARTQIATMNKNVTSISEKAVFLRKISCYKHKLHQAKEKEELN